MAGWGKRWSGLPAGKRAPKYGNKKVMVGAIEFDSKKEAQHYHELKLREKAKEIRELRLQVPFAIVIDNVHICNYIADFVYEEKIMRPVHQTSLGYVPEETWVPRVVDTKGMKTEVYRLKKKLMKAVLGIEILEV